MAPSTPIKASRVLAHRVIVDGIDYGMAIAEISPDGLQASVSPFEGETWGTAFVSGAVEARRGEDGRYAFFQSK